LSNNIFKNSYAWFVGAGFGGVSIMVHNTKHKVLFNEINFKIKLRIGVEKANPRY
jgi:hypothetical protein